VPAFVSIDGGEGGDAVRAFALAGEQILNDGI
jgi:hypothetical protein